MGLLFFAWKKSPARAGEKNDLEVDVFEEKWRSDRKQLEAYSGQAASRPKGLAEFAASRAADRIWRVSVVAQLCHGEGGAALAGTAVL